MQRPWPLEGLVNQAIDDLIVGAGKLPTIPSVYIRLRAVIDNMRSSNRDVAALISEDAALAARLLRIANSSFYGFSSTIDSITRAVTIIGTQQIADIVLATVVREMFEDIPEDRVNMHGFWQDSIACGVTARILATFRGAVNVERYFVAGLLHDIGRLVMFQSLGEKYWHIIDKAEETGELLYVMERKVLGFDHGDVGARLLQRWELPQYMIDSVKYHHQSVGNRYTCIDAAVVHVADVISMALRVARDETDVLISPLDEVAWNALALPVSIISPVASQLELQYRDAAALIFPEGDESGYACA